MLMADRHLIAILMENIDRPVSFSRVFGFDYFRVPRFPFLDYLPFAVGDVLLFTTEKGRQEFQQQIHTVMNITIPGVIAVLLAGMGLGWLICWLWAKMRQAEVTGALQLSASQELRTLQQGLATAEAGLHAAGETLAIKKEELGHALREQSDLRQQLFRAGQDLVSAQADNRALEGRLNLQLEEIQRLQQKFSIEFENVANRISDVKSVRFPELNKNNLEAILGPLGKSIGEFKDQVDKAYNAEARERFSLGEKVKDLIQLNQILSQEQKNLTRALKAETKTQGRWGEVILETILEKSGLRKGEEFFMEEQLYGADGQPLRGEARQTKMRPDSIVKYPDNRHVII